MARKRCEHNREICSECIVITDAAKRFSDGIRLICTFSPLAERKSAFVAVRLADGNVDYTLFPSKREAIAHQSNEKLYAFLSLRNVPAGITPRDAAVWLELHRYMYDHGFGLQDPEAPDLIMPQGRDQRITRPVDPNPYSGFLRRR